MEEPPPPPSLRAPPALPDDLVEEVLLRSPPDDPARLVRAALVCKRWSRLVSARAFRRRFREFHLRRRAVPMLGFLRNEFGSDDVSLTHFVRTSASCPPLDTQRGWFALDARGGRVLLHSVDGATAGLRLAVCDPLSVGGRGHLQLPVPVLPRRPRSWNAALLCCDQHGLQDHPDGPFRVVLVGTDPEGTFACVYSSSGPAAWCEPAYAAQHSDVAAVGKGGPVVVDPVRAALVGNAFYFVFQMRTRILKYDLATGDMSVISLPSASHKQCIVLTTTEDGGLGFARMEGCKLCLWSMEPRPNGGALSMEWTRGREIDLRTLLPIIDLRGFAHGVGIILVGTIDGYFTVDQKSGRIDKVGDGPGFYDVVPYVSFYTPAVGTTSTNEGPTANA